MKTLVVYSSRTGNTRKIAEAIHAVMPEGAAIASVENAPDPAGFDFLALGFWVDKGAPDADMLAYMDKVKSTRVGLFGTLGAWPDSPHAAESMQKGVDRMAGNEVMGTFICQGKVDPAITAAMNKMPEAAKVHPMTEERRARLEEAAKHPDEADCDAARRVFADIVRQLHHVESPCAK